MKVLPVFLQEMLNDKAVLYTVCEQNYTIWRADFHVGRVRLGFTPAAKGLSISES